MVKSTLNFKIFLNWLNRDDHSSSLLKIIRTTKSTNLLKLAELENLKNQFLYMQSVEFFKCEKKVQFNLSKKLLFIKFYVFKDFVLFVLCS